MHTYVYSFTCVCVCLHTCMCVCLWMYVWRSEDNPQELLFSFRPVGSAAGLFTSRAPSLALYFIF